MNRALLALPFALVAVSACSPAESLKGAPWTVRHWTYHIDSVVPGGTDTTDEDSVDDAGTLEFGSEEDVAGFSVLTRHLTSVTARGTNDASFAAQPLDDTVEWAPDPTDANIVGIFDGADTLWNGDWTVEGTTLTRSLTTDFGGGQLLTETSTLELSR